MMRTGSLRRSTSIELGIGTKSVAGATEPSCRTNDISSRTLWNRIGAYCAMRRIARAPATRLGRLVVEGPGRTVTVSTIPRIAFMGSIAIGSTGSATVFAERNSDV